MSNGEKANTALALVIDDEPQIRRLLTISLEADAYRVLTAATGNEGLVLAEQHRPEIILLDLGLPDLGGLEVLQRLREWTQTPVVILTVQDAEAEKVAALDGGADDYVTKPFSPRELRGRIKAVLRRCGEGDDGVLRFGDCEVDVERGEVRRGGRVLDITAVEFRLLTTFLRRRSRVFSREQLIDMAWGESTNVTDRVVDTHVLNIRKKIEPDPAHPRFLVSVRGMGYRFDG